MTAPNGPIIFNSSTGSDTAASGLGPATAVSGTGASLNATSTVTLSADSPDLSGVSAGDLLWVDTSSGRQFSIIASVDDGADTVTCDDAFAVTESGRNWGIGGKRATWDNADSRTIFGSAGAKSGWIIETETDQTLTSAITISWGISSYVLIRGLTGAKRIITQTANAAHFTESAQAITVRNLEFHNTNASKTNAKVITVTGGSGHLITAIDCVFGHASNTVNGAIRRDSGGIAEIRCLRCRFISTTGNAITYGSSSLRLTGCIFSQCSGSIGTSGGINSIIIDGCIFASSGNGLNITNTGNGDCRIQGNLFYDMTNGLLISVSWTPNGQILNNVFVNSSAYGIDFSGATINGATIEVDYNAFYNNTSGDVTGIANGDNDLTLTADPFVDAAGGDYNINDTAGGGIVLRGVEVTL